MSVIVCEQTWPLSAHQRNTLLTNWSYLRLWPNELGVLCLHGQANQDAATGATKSSLASAGARGAPMHAVEPGSANTFGGLLARLQNVAQSIAALSLVVPLNAETARSTTSKR